MMPTSTTDFTNDAVVWLTVIGCGLVSLAYRVLPALVPGIRDATADAPWIRFFDYASYCVIGGIVSLNLLSVSGVRDGQQWVGAAVFEGAFLAGLAGVAVTFGITLTTGRQVTAIIVGLGLYQVLYWALV